VAELRAFLVVYLAKVGAYQGEALLTAVYWTVIAGTWVILRLSGRRLLPNTFGSRASHWIPREPIRRDPVSISRQY
jgi:hypothetical protein